MKCLLKYQWVKLLRAHLPQGKGVMGYWARLAARAAFRKGEAHYCGYANPVSAGMWSGGIVGLKSILGVKSKTVALQILDDLKRLGYIEYTLNPSTKKLEYFIKDWVLQCSGAGCMNGAVYTTEGYGFLCLPRNITQRLTENQYQFEEADAWLDLWCHTVWQDPRNAFSFWAPAIQYGSYGAALTLETLGQRWGWEKTKVWRFFQKYGDVFVLYRLPGSFGCLIFNKLYPTGAEVSMPVPADIERIIGKMRIIAGNTHIAGTDHVRLNKMILWFSRQIIAQDGKDVLETEAQDRVALSTPILRAYLSLCWNCKNCSYDCGNVDIFPVLLKTIRGPCAPIFEQAKENFHEQTERNQRQGALRTAGTEDFHPVRCFHPSIDAKRHSGGSPD